MFNKKMMEQAQKMMQDMSQAQADLSKRVFEGSAGGGAVTVHCGGDLKIQKIQIKPEAVDPEDVEMLEDLVLAAVNDALKQAQDTTKQEMGKLTGGLGGLGLGF